MWKKASENVFLAMIQHIKKKENPLTKLVDQHPDLYAQDSLPNVHELILKSDIVLT